jgi:hypothetical protein
MVIEISHELRQKLVKLRNSQLDWLRQKAEGEPYRFISHFYEELLGIEGVHLWGTLGADLYLTFDGRLLLSEDHGDRQSIEEVCGLAFKATAFTTGAYANNLLELLDFLPTRPTGEPPCTICQGARTVDGMRACPFCCGLGWGKQLLDKRQS